MTDLADMLLTALLNHGALVLGTTLFLAALGLPLPASMLLMAAGAFAQQGVLGIPDAATAALAGSVAGDSSSYGVGRLGAQHIPRRLLESVVWTRANKLFAQWGLYGIFLTRFLLTPVALPVNLLAGSTRYPLSRYLAAAVVGQATWIVLYGGAGYLFAREWEIISSLAADAVGLLAGFVLLWLGARRVLQFVRQDR